MKKSFHRKPPFKKKDDGLSAEEQIQQEIRRIQIPQPPQTFGILEQRLGGSRLRVRCLDGKTRVCRIPGRLKKKLWVREGDLLIIEPWQFSGDEKGDVIFKYKPIQVKWLREKGHLTNLDDFAAF